MARIGAPAAQKVEAMSEEHAPRVNKTIEAITEKNIESILCDEDARRAKMPWIYRAVGQVARFCGTVTFLVANIVVFAAWVALNQGPEAIDPYPFTFLLFIVSLEAIFLSIMILIGQNLVSAENERRHHLDLQINLLNERETTALLRLNLSIAEHLGIDEDLKHEAHRLAHRTDPSAVLKQIVTAERRHNDAPPGVN